MLEVIKTSNIQWFASTSSCLWAESVEILKPSTFPRDAYYMWAHGINYAEHLGKEYPISRCAPRTQYRCHSARLVWANSDFFSISTNFYIFIFSPFTRGFPGCFFLAPEPEPCWGNISEILSKNYFQPKSNLKLFARTRQPCRPVCNCNATVFSTWENCSEPNRSSMKRRVRSQFGSTDALHFQVGRSDCLVLTNGKR